jgi:hypothetical protein
MTNEQGKNSRSNKHTLRRTLCIILALIILLFIFTSAILASRLAELVGRGDRPVLLEAGTNADIEIFKIEYVNGQGEITVQGANGQKVVAPGTDNRSFLHLKNVDTTAIDYILNPKVTFASEHEIPLQVRLIAPDGNYILGSEDAWADVNAMNSIPDQENTIGKGKEAVYTLEWKWAFRSENPEDVAYDTLLGDAAAAGENVGLEISFTTQATANTTIDANGGFIKSGALGHVLYGILWILLLIALILLIIALIKGRDKKDPEAPVPPPPTPEPTLAPKANKHHIPPIIPKKAHAKKESFNGKMEYINLDTIAAAFAPGERVTLATLKARGMIPAEAKQMKILARNGETLSKPLIVETQGISSRARHLIIAAGGQVIITKG